MKIQFQKAINTDPEILALKVAQGQDHFVESVEQCFQDAKEEPRYCPLGIYDGNRLIGFAMYGLFEEEGDGKGRVWLDRLLIDGRYQRMGYGTAALEALIEKLRWEFHCKQIFLSVVQENTVAISLYEKHGFRCNGELDLHGERVMVLDLDADGLSKNALV